MKALKFIGLALLAIGVVALIVAAIMPKDYSVEREITINRPKAIVFDYIRHLKNQNYYGKWNMTDPNAKMDYKGTDGEVGFVYLWDSQNEHVGKGRQEIVKITDGERMDMSLQFFKPFDGKATAYMATEAAGDNQTKVKWGFNSSMAFPMNLMIVCMKDILGTDLQTGLGNLKNNLEKQ